MRKRPLQRSGAVWLTCILGLSALAGCGSDGNEAGGDGASVKVMVVSSENSSYYNFPEVWTIADAFAKDFNANGGFDGRDLEIVKCNDQADPNLSVRCAREAASDKVAALVGGLSIYGDKVFPVLEAAKIPWLGNNPFSSADLTSAYSFPTNSLPFQYAEVGKLSATECSRPALIYLDNALNQANLASFVDPGLKSEDPSKDWVTVVKTPLEVSDYTPFVEQLKQASPDCVYVMLTTADQQRIAPVMERLQLSARFLSPSASFSQAVIEASPAALEGAIIPAGAPLPDAPQWAEAKAAIAKYVPNPDEFPLMSGNASNTWIALKAFTQVAGGISGDIDAASVYTALNSASKVDTGGLTLPFDFSKEFPAEGYNRLFGRSVWNWTVTDGTLTNLSTAPMDLSALLETTA